MILGPDLDKSASPFLARRCRDKQRQNFSKDHQELNPLGALADLTSHGIENKLYKLLDPANRYSSRTND